MVVAFHQPWSPTRRLTAGERVARVCVRSTQPGKGGTAASPRPRPRLFILELEDFVPERSEENEKCIADFAERIEVHSKSRPTEPVRVIYSTGESFPETIRRLGWRVEVMPGESSTIEDVVTVPLPDVLLTLNGLEVYQKGYRTPDPYWSSRVMGGWDPKPARWIVSKFFEKSLRPITSEDDKTQLKYARKMNPGEEATPGMILVANVEAKMSEMGLKCRVINDEENEEISIIPAGGSVTEAVRFVQGMMGVASGSSLIFGSSQPYLELMKTNLGVCPKDLSEEPSDRRTEETGRVFFSEKVGAPALVDGIVHHAFI